MVDQRWLRISADDPQPGMTATVTTRSATARAARPAPSAVTAVPGDLNADQITTTDAAVTVRSGDSAAVPVLAGDASSTGLPLIARRRPRPPASPPITGLLASDHGTDVRVDAPGRRQGRGGDDRQLRRDRRRAAPPRPASWTSRSSRRRPRPTRTRRPSPQEVDTRETAGDVAVIQIPTYGIDPDGDSVTVTGVTVPPALGRIVAIGPDSISYQSYPGSSGTDTFTYQVTDPYGLTGTAQVRVAILPPGPPQPPVAVDDVINAPPGATLHWNVLANDFVAPGDTATVVPLGKTNRPLPAGVRLAGSYVYLHAPGRAVGPARRVHLRDHRRRPRRRSPRSSCTPCAGAKLPPIASDDVAPPPAAGAATVTVNVLQERRRPGRVARRPQDQLGARRGHRARRGR